MNRRDFLATSIGAFDLRFTSVWKEFDYGDVVLAPGLAQSQFEQTRDVLLSLNDDSLLKPWRLRAGLPAPGPELGGWYDEVPLHKTESGGHGFAPAHCFGQWLSALARGYAVDRDARTRAKLQRLLALYKPTISTRFYTNFRFPAYNYDKLVTGLIDAHQFAQAPDALPLLDRTTDAAEPRLPPSALDRDEPQRRWRQSVGESTANDYTWDESYTLPENLYLVYERTGKERYRQLARRFLLDRTYFDPLSEGRNVLPGHHAYSFCNALSSAMQAYLIDGSEKHKRAAENAFDMIATGQSFATGGWGPNESFENPAGHALLKSLGESHRSFETPCGSYAHFKLTRHLLRVKHDGKYGDSMERVFYNTVLGAKPLSRDGQAFYYSDYHSAAAKSYHPDAWPCCSGTLPQVTADYRKLIYFHDGRGTLFMNLYLPSALRWVDAGGVEVRLEQSGDYPTGNRIECRVSCSRPANFALRFRVPAWAAGRPGTQISVNGHRIPVRIQSGFAEIRRTWRSGDSIQLTFDMNLRVESIDAAHPDTVALLHGPLVLFAMAANLTTITRKQLLAARRVPGQTAWQASSTGGILQFKPFTEIKDERYLTYLQVS